LGFGSGWQCPIQELPNRFADFVMMGLKRKMSSIKEVDFSIGINKNDRDLKSFVFQLLLEIETADSRKTHIDYQATGATGGCLCKNCSAVSKHSERDPADFSNPWIDART
jgi:hypothetical protein